MSKTCILCGEGIVVGNVCPSCLEKPQSSIPSTSVVGQDTGFTDNGLTPIRVGDRMTVPRHNNPCCEHWVTCTIKWNDEWQAYGMQADDGEWVSGMGIAGGYAVMSNATTIPSGAE